MIIARFNRLVWHHFYFSPMNGSFLFIECFSVWNNKIDVNIELQIQSSVSDKRHKIVHKYRKWKQNKTKNIRNVNDWFHFHRTSNCLTCKYSAKVSYLKIDCNVCVDKCSPEFNHVERLKTAYDCAYFYCSGNSYCFQEIAIFYSSNR